MLRTVPSMGDRHRRARGASRGRMHRRPHGGELHAAGLVPVPRRRRRRDATMDAADGGDH